MIIFPTNPVDGQIVTVGTKKWQYVLATKTWDILSTPSQAAADAQTAATQAQSVLSSVSGTGGSNLIPFLQSGTGAVSRMVQTKLRETVSVEDFGAKGDGVTDDTVAIQAAINAAVNGSVIQFRGAYLVTGTLQVNTRNITFSGENKNTSLKFLGTGALIQLDVDDNLAWDATNYNGRAQGFSIENMNLNCINDGTTGKPRTALLNSISGKFYGTGTYGIRDWRGGSTHMRRVFIQGFEYGYWGVQADINVGEDLTIGYNHVGIFLGPRTDQGNWNKLWTFGNDTVWQIEGAKNHLISQWISDTDGSGTTAPAVIRNSSTAINATKYTATRIHSGIVFDTPWLEQLGSLGSNNPGYDVFAIFEINIGDTLAGSGVHIRSPYIATQLYSDATKPHYFYLVRAGLVQSVDVSNANGPWSSAKAIFYVDATATTTPRLTFTDAESGSGRLVESYAASSTFVQVRSNGFIQNYTANTLGGTGSVGIGNLGLHKALVHNNGPMTASASSGDITLNRIYSSGRSLGWAWNGAAPVVIHAPTVGGGSGWIDADRTLTPETDHEEQIAPIAITADRNVILAAPPQSAVGYRFRITRPAGAFNLMVRNLTVGGTLMKTMPGNSWAEFIYDGTNWTLRGSGNLGDVYRINVRDFGAKGDGTTDDQAAINACALYCKTNGYRMYIPPGNYRVTRSLDFTKANPNDAKPLFVEGDTKMQSLITLDLVEAFPGIDVTNNKRGALVSLIVRSTSASLDTCSLFVAETIASGVNSFTVQDCEIYNSSLNAKASTIGFCSDQLFFDNSEAIANGPAAVSALVVAGSNKYNIISKFLTVTAQGGDQTYIRAHNSNFVSVGTPLDVEDYSMVVFDKCYFANTGAVTPTSMIRLKSNARQMQPVFTNCRSEDQSTGTGANVFQIVDQVYNGEFTGTFTTKGTTVGTFTGPGTMIFSKFHGGVSGSLFGDAGPMVDCSFDVTAGADILGTMSAPNVALCSNVSIRGRVGTFANVMTLLGTVPGLVIGTLGVDTNTPYSASNRLSTHRVIFPRADSPVNFRVTASGPAQVINPSAYTGGSGLQTIGTVDVPTSSLAWVGASSVYHVYPFIDVEIVGDTASGFGAGGTLALTVTQGVNTTTLATLGSIPAGTNGFRMKFRVQVTGSTTFTSFSEIECAPSAGGSKLAILKYTNLQSLSFDKDNTTPFTLGVQVNNSVSTPISHLFYTMRT